MMRFGGVTNPRSGARWDRRNDGRSDRELVEFKRTDNRRSITLFVDDLLALYRHAVGECRVPVLCFELCGKHWVVLPESDYHELVPDRGPSESAPGRGAGNARLARPGQVPGAARQPVLRRPPAQRSGLRGQVGVLGNPPGPPRPLPSPRPVSRLRPQQQREVGGLGRVLRKRAPQAEAPETP